MVSEKLNLFSKIIVGITLFQTKCAKTDTLETKEEESCTSQQNKTNESKTTTSFNQMDISQAVKKTPGPPNF